MQNNIFKIFQKIHKISLDISVDEILQWILMIRDTDFEFQLSEILFSHSVVSDSLQPLDCSTPGFPVLHYLLEFAEIHVHRVGDAI